MATADKTFQAYSADGETLDCMRCKKLLHAKDVAMFVRTRPADAFNAWCPACTRWLMATAALGLDLEEDAAIVIAF